MHNRWTVANQEQDNQSVFILDSSKLSKTGDILIRLYPPFLAFSIFLLVLSTRHAPNYVSYLLALQMSLPLMFLPLVSGAIRGRNRIVVDPSGLKFGWEKGPSAQNPWPIFPFIHKLVSTPPITALECVEKTEKFTKSGEARRQIQMTFSVDAHSMRSIIHCFLIWLFISKTGFCLCGTQLLFRLTLDTAAFGHWTDEDRLVKLLLEISPTVQVIGHSSDVTVTSLWLEDFNRADHSKESLKPGVVLHEQYKIERRLTTGGQANIYEAACTADDEPCVLKEFILPVGTKQHVQKRLAEHIEQEVALLNKLDDPRVVKLKEFFADDQRIYLVLEKVAGSTLSAIVKEHGPLAPDSVLDLAKQMSGILSFLHSQTPPVVHRDFTPDNLMLDSFGKLRVIDFSVAEELESTATRTFVGKNSYVPPEQFRGKATEQSDLYAMGATLYFLLTGTDPQPLTCSVPPSESGEQLCTLVKQLTALQAEQRPATISEVMAQLG